MVLTALLLGLLGVALTVGGARVAFDALGLDVRETLLWFGLAERPLPTVSRRPAERRGQEPVRSRRATPAPVRSREPAVAARRAQRCA